MTCQKVVSKRLVINASKWVHTLRWVITAIHFSYLFLSLVYLRTYGHLPHTVLSCTVSCECEHHVNSAFLSKDVWRWWLTGTGFRYNCALIPERLSGLWNCTYVLWRFYVFRRPKNTTFCVFWVVAHVFSHARWLRLPLPEQLVWYNLVVIWTCHQQQHLAPRRAYTSSSLAWTPKSSAQLHVSL